MWLALPGASSGAPAEGPEVGELARLVGPTVIGRLDEDDFKARFRIILAHIERTRIAQGFHAEEQVERALALKNVSRDRARKIAFGERETIGKVALL